MFSFNEYFGFRIYTNFLALIALSGVAAFSGYSKETTAIIMIVGIAKLFESTSDIVMGYFQKIERMHIISISLMLRGVLALIVLTTAIYLSSSLVWGVTMLAAAWAFVLIFYDLPNCKMAINNGNAIVMGQVNSPKLKLFPSFDSRSMMRIAVLSLPLGVVSFLLSLETNIPKYYLENLLGQESLGYFASMAYLILVGSKFINAIGQVVMPRLSKLYHVEDRKGFLSLFCKGIACCAFLGTLIVTVSYLWGGAILSFLYGPEYTQHSDVFVWVMLSGALNYIATLLWLSLIATRQIRIQMPINLIYIICLTLSCMALIPEYHLLGAAYAMVITCSLKLVFNLFFNVRAISKLKR